MVKISFGGTANSSQFFRMRPYIRPDLNLHTHAISILRSDAGLVAKFFFPLSEVIGTMFL